MGRRNARRLALVLIALAACVVNLSFDLRQQGIALVTPAAGSASQSIPFDLGTSQDIRAHQKDIRSLDLDSVDVTITDIKADNAATSLSLSVALRKNLDDPPANDVKIGDLQGFTVAPQATRRIPGNPAVDTFLLDRVRDGGKFYIMVSGTTNAKTDLLVDLNLHVSMGYDSGLF